MGDVLVGASSGGGKGGVGKGKFERSVREKTKVSEGGGEVVGGEGGEAEKAEAAEEEDDEEEDLDGLKDVWEEMYKARGELEEGETT